MTGGPNPGPQPPRNGLPNPYPTGTNGLYPNPAGTNPIGGAKYADRVTNPPENPFSRNRGPPTENPNALLWEYEYPPP